MTEYWKSYAKKFCEICKIWYADNKVSAERHEQGLRHKAMVQQRLRESAKKAKDKEVEDHELRMTLLSMEQAARASFSSREEREVPMFLAPRIITSQKHTAEPTEEDEVKEKLREQKRKLAALKKRSKQSQFWSPDEGEMGGGDLPLEEELADWVQAETSDGQFYYWHIYTGETRWEQPEKFYTSAQYAERYASIVEETTDHREGGQCANSAYDLTQSANLSIAGPSQTACPELIDPTFVHQMTVAEVNNQMTSTKHEAPPPVKKYYGMREKHGKGSRN
ncbi:hypothetical protein niasHT_025043 [Heterodera trifolii]|uniref:WW domain-binding protein 4 n=1 Tax=Heterodera trifolii TaxID=157864 RepID=A0ABD2KLN2_9BILA